MLICCNILHIYLCSVSPSSSRILASQAPWRRDCSVAQIVLAWVGRADRRKLEGLLFPSTPTACTPTLQSEDWGQRANEKEAKEETHLKAATKRCVCAGGAASIWQAGRVAGVRKGSLLQAVFWVCVFLRVPFFWGGFEGKPRGETVEMGVPLF